MLTLSSPHFATLNFNTVSSRPSFDTHVTPISGLTFGNSPKPTTKPVTKRHQIKKKPRTPLGKTLKKLQLQPALAYRKVRPARQAVNDVAVKIDTHPRAPITQKALNFVGSLVLTGASAITVGFNQYNVMGTEKSLATAREGVSQSIVQGQEKLKRPTVDMFGCAKPIADSDDDELRFPRRNRKTGKVACPPGTKIEVSTVERDIPTVTKEQLAAVRPDPVAVGWAEGTEPLLTGVKGSLLSSQVVLGVSLFLDAVSGVFFGAEVLARRKARQQREKAEAKP